MCALVYLPGLTMSLRFWLLKLSSNVVSVSGIEDGPKGLYKPRPKYNMATWLGTGLHG